MFWNSVCGLRVLPESQRELCERMLAQDHSEGSWEKKTRSCPEGNFCSLINTSWEGFCSGSWLLLPGTPVTCHPVPSIGCLATYHHDLLVFMPCVPSQAMSPLKAEMCVILMTRVA